VPQAKSLSNHVSERSFRARRHHELLAGPVLRWPELASIQARYVAADHPLERRAIAVEFERAVAGGRDDEDDDVERELDRIRNMPPALYDPETRSRARVNQAHARAIFARDLRGKGLSLDAIVERLGVTRATVSRYLAELDVASAAPGVPRKAVARARGRAGRSAGESTLDRQR
jgi:hypothetical protein